MAVIDSVVFLYNEKDNINIINNLMSINMGLYIFIGAIQEKSISSKDIAI